jgi:hypothetical protein
VCVCVCFCDLITLHTNFGIVQYNRWIIVLVIRDNTDASRIIINMLYHCSTTNGIYYINPIKLYWFQAINCARCPCILVIFEWTWLARTLQCIRMCSKLVRMASNSKWVQERDGYNWLKCIEGSLTNHKRWEYGLTIRNYNYFLIKLITGDHIFHKNLSNIILVVIKTAINSQGFRFLRDAELWCYCSLLVVQEIFSCGHVTNFFNLFLICSTMCEAIK